MLATFLFLLSVLGAAQSGGNSTGQPATADIETIRQKALAGNADAQLQLGEAYENGAGVKRSDEEAARWYRAAAEQGNASAEVDLGVLYWTGRGVSGDKERAVDWYLKAARQGNSNGMFNLGVAYFNGEGTRVDPYEALAWFLLADKGGSKPAAEAIRRTASSLEPRDLYDAYYSIGQR